MNYALPFSIEVKFPITRKQIIIFAVILVILDLFLFLFISFLSLNSNFSQWSYLILLAPIFLFFLVFSLNINKYKISFDENGITYTDRYGKKVANYADIVSVESGFQIKTEFHQNIHATPGVTFSTAINIRNSDPIIVDAYWIGGDDMEKMVNIITGKNPAVKLDKYSSALKVGDIKPVQGAMRKALILTLVGILGVILLRIILDLFIGSPIR